MHEATVKASSPHLKPDLVLLQGCFQRPAVYGKLHHALERLSYPVTHPVLPSCHDTDKPDFPNITLTDDSNAVREAIQKLLEHDKTVVVVCHSYGGIVGSNAISEDMAHASRKQHGKEGGVLLMFMFATFVLPLGQSVLEAFGESPQNDVKGDGRFFIKNAKETLYSDVPQAEADHFASQLIVSSYKVQQTKTVRAAYTHLPCTYLICDKDQACPPAYQEMFAKQINAEVEHCGTGHSPMLVDPEMLARRIDLAVMKVL